MKKFSLVAAFVAFSFASFADNWKADIFHSKLGFAVTHMGIADVPGHFGDFEVKINAQKPDFSDASLVMTAKISSIDTRVEPRDNHLKSADFFDAEQHPEMNFKSTSIKKTGKNEYELAGNLTMRGITKPVKVRMVYRGTAENAKGEPVAGIQITGKIKRSDFSIGEKFPAPMISDEVLIKADGEFIKE